MNVLVSVVMVGSSVSRFELISTDLTRCLFCVCVSELATVKKGTPLYGQPAWWGEDTEANGRSTPHF